MNIFHDPIGTRSGRGTARAFALCVAGLILLAQAAATAADTLVLQDISHTPMSGGEVQIRFAFSGPAPEPGTFTIDNPPRLAVDLPNTLLGRFDRNQELGGGVVQNIRAVQAGARSRVVIALERNMVHELRRQDNMVYLHLKRGTPSQAPQTVAVSGRQPVEASPRTAGASITHVDFRRTGDGEGEISVTLSDPRTIADLRRQDRRLVLEFVGSTVPESLERRLDVTDFATPVRTVDVYNHQGNARLVITPEGPHQHMAYQVGDRYTIIIQKEAPEEEQRLSQDAEFSGEKLSLNFQDIDVRAVLQLIGDFTGLNIVASDTVQGRITLRLRNVPWDQAMDIILRARGLDMRRSGDVIMVAPAEEIAQRERLALESRQQMVELAPLYTEFFEINYARAADLARLLQSDANTLLSTRGNITLDQRTNTLMVLDTEDRLVAIRRVIERLDIPVRQVLIESRIVIANDDFSRSLGARFGVTNVAPHGSSGIIATTGTSAGTDTMVNSAIPDPSVVSIPAANDRFNVSLPAIGAAGQIGLAILGGDYLVDLELSALQQEGRGEVISNPRVITSNQREAVIEQGVEIPYQEAAASGATAISFKKAVLSLGVTPQITPDDRVSMDLRVSKDSVGGIYAGVPSINTRAVNTQVLVDNGDTVVLGGIYEQTTTNAVEKVPLLGDIPILGALFRRTTIVDDKAELLIFVTPKILKQDEMPRTGMLH